MNFTKQFLRAWDSTLASALKLPLNRVSRYDFLAKSLNPFLSFDGLERLHTQAPQTLVSMRVIDRLASDVIEYHTKAAAGLAVGTGLLGGINVLLGASVDTLQYFGNLLQMTQKLAYLYGWEDFRSGSLQEEEVRARLTFLLGSALGVQEADLMLRHTALRGHSPHLAEEILPKETALKLYKNILRSLSYAAYICAGKTILCGVVSDKLTPVLGATASWAATYYFIRPQGLRLKNLLGDIAIETEEMQGRLPQGSL